MNKKLFWTILINERFFLKVRCIKKLKNEWKTLMNENLQKKT